MNNFANRLKQLRQEKHLTMDKLIEDLTQKYPESKISKGMVSRWENGGFPNNKNQQILAKYFHVSVDYLIGKSDYKNSWEEYDAKLGEKRLQQITDEVNFYENLDQSKKGVQIPVLGTVAAGIPISAHEDILDYEEISTDLANKGIYFGLKIKGSSMEPTLYDGDTVIVRQQDDIENGEIGIVLINGDEATTKEIKKTKEGITLIGHNVAVFSPKFFTNQEIIDLPVRIIGKVIELRRKLG